MEEHTAFSRCTELLSRACTGVEKLWKWYPGNVADCDEFNSKRPPTEVCLTHYAHQLDRNRGKAKPARGAVLATRLSQAAPHAVRW